MSIRCIALLLWIVAMGLVPAATFAQDAATTDNAATTDETAETAPENPRVAANRNEPPPPNSASPVPTGMVFDPTTGRYMPAAEPLPWRNSFFVFDNSLNRTTVDNSTLSDTSYWIQTYSLRPRWNFTQTLSLRVRQDLYVEWVAATVTSETQPVIFDTQVDLVEADLLTIEGVIIGVGARVLLPTSRLSRNANRVASTGGLLTATKVFANVLSGFVTQVSTTYQRWWATSTTSTSYEPGTLCIADNNAFPCSRFATPTSIRDTFTVGLFGQLSFTPVFSAGVAFSWWWQRAAGLDPVDLGGLGPGVSGSLRDMSNTHWRNLTATSLFLAYQVNTWLQASIGMNTLTPQLNPNGSVRNPFWNPDTQYSLTAVVTIDQLYTAIRDAGTSEPSPDAHTARLSSHL